LIQFIAGYFETDKDNWATTYDR